MRTRPLFLAALLFMVPGCADEPSPSVEPSPLPPATVPPTPQPATAQPPPHDCVNETVTDNIEVVIREADNAFSPDCLVVLGGQSLVIENQGSAKHNLTIEGSSVDIDTAPGQTSRTEAIGGAVTPGTHPFFCKYHRALGMDGEITVSEAG
ncbi:MAG TPA: cupredoxin domain-containing protein [Actinomycetota bacterium]|nr:cupredoxin domain-containing protein [Actinomycetota bacterium]